MTASAGRVTAMFLVAACIMSGGACSNVLGITDVPDGAAPSKDASDDADFIDAGDVDTGSNDDGGLTCFSGGNACGDFVTSSPLDPGGDCCTNFCIGNSVGTAGTCSDESGTYRVTINGTKATVLGSFLNTQFSPPQIQISFTYPGLDDPDHLSYVGIDLEFVDTGCETNHVSLFLEQGEDLVVYDDDGTSTCGLDVTSTPPTSISATFDGTLTDTSSHSATLSVGVSQSYP